MGKMTPGPWEYVPSNEHHGPYVAGPFGGDICDCYTMSHPALFSTANGGPSKPIHHQQEAADANARAIAALPDVLEALRDARNSGLIYWEPQTARGVEQKALMLARIDAALAKAAGTEG